MTAYWLHLKVQAHGKHPMSSKDSKNLRIYFDEKPKDKSDEIGEGDYMQVPDEYGVIYEGEKDYYIQITEAEYNASDYALYIWFDPYGIGAVSSGDKLYGRLKLTAKEGVKEEANSPAPIKAGDKKIKHTVIVGDSVAVYMTNEINSNVKTGTVSNIKSASDRSDKLSAMSGNYFDEAHQTINEGGILNWIKGAFQANLAGDIMQQSAIYNAESSYRLGRATHSNSGDIASKAQDILFLGGGEWDHKPKISPIWGERNRLGNSRKLYFYDYWSNIHYGYIAAAGGMNLTRALWGAGQAQTIDNMTTGGDDDYDAEAIKEGYQLYAKKPNGIVYKDLLNIFESNPSWKEENRGR